MEISWELIPTNSRTYLNYCRAQLKKLTESEKSVSDLVSPKRVCQNHEKERPPVFLEVELGLSPFPVTVANEGLAWDSLLKME